MAARHPFFAFLSGLGLFILSVSLFLLLPANAFDDNWKMTIGGIITGIVTLLLGSLDSLFKKNNVAETAGTETDDKLLNEYT